MAIVLGDSPTSILEVLNGTDDGDTIDHLGGPDNVYGGRGFDRLIFNDISDNFTVLSLSGVTRIVGESTAAPSYRGATVTTSSVEEIVFLDKVISLSGTNSNIILGINPSEPIEQFTGTTGNDVIDHAGGPDRIDGGDGIDKVLFFDNKDNYTIVTVAGITRVVTSTSRTGGKSNYSGNEVVLFNVEMIEFLDGVVFTGADDNTVGELIIGTSGDDVLSGGDGDDTIDHGGGADDVDGAGGIDTLLYYTSSSNVRITSLLGVTKVLGLSHAGADYAGNEVRLINVEKIQFNNTLVDLEATPLGVMLGTSGAETLIGSDGDDIIDHGGGTDIINGGEGFDTIIFFDSVSNYRITNTNGVFKVLGLGDADTIRAAVPYSAMEVTLTNVESILFRDRRITTGNSRDETMQTWSGKDVVDGGAGVDTVVFAGAQSAYSVARTSTGFTVDGAASDANTLQNVERLQFADLTLAFDIFAETPLYNTVLMGPAAVGRAFIDDPYLMGSGLRFAQQYDDMQELAEAVVDLGIYDNLTNQQFVQYLYQNVQHVPTVQEASLYEWALDFGVDRSVVLRIFAESDYNEQSVNLVGLQQTGVEFV